LITSFYAAVASIDTSGTKLIEDLKKSLDRKSMQVELVLV
jgi:MFS superfamily sulfate permease-like transporter